MDAFCMLKTKQYGRKFWKVFMAIVSAFLCKMIVTRMSTPILEFQKISAQTDTC